MPIGDNITQPIPVVGEAGTGYATKIINFLTEVKTRLEAKVPLSSLLAGLFDLSNNPIGNIKYAGLYEQVSAPATPVGSLQRYGGELYYVSPSGAVRITNAGNLDVVGANGITGDYAGPAEFKYVLADTEYYAYSDHSASPKKWAYVGGRAFDVYGGLQSIVRVRVTWAGVTSYTLTLPAALPAETLTVKMDASGNLSTTPFDKTKSVSPIVALQYAPSVPHTKNLNDWTLANSAEPIYWPLSIHVGDTIKTYGARVNKASGSGVTLRVRLWSVDSAGTVTQLGSGATNSAAAPGNVFVSETLGSPHVVVQGSHYYIEFAATVGNPTGDKVRCVETTHTFKV